MALFYKRPLAAALFALAAAITACFFLPFFFKILFACLAFAALVIIVVLRLRRGASYRLLSLGLLAAALLLGLGRGMLETDVMHTALTKQIGNETMAELQVISLEQRTSYSSEVVVRITSLGGRQVNERAVLRTSYLFPMGVNDRFCGSFTVRELDYDAFYQGQENQYRAEGCSALLISEDTDSFVFLESGEGKLDTALLDLRDRWAHTLSEEIGGEAGELAAALIFGTRHTLGEDTIRDFRRAGVSHILALSGLHLAILIGFVDRLLYRLRVGKPWRLSVTLVLAIGYWMLTGCSHSMTRAVLMFLVVYSSYFMMQESDPITALFLAGSAILLVSPFAIFSISYQMTMLATFGILLVGGLNRWLQAKLPHGKGIVRIPCFLLRYTLLSILITVCATAAVLPVQWAAFGELSLITPLSNLLLTPLLLPLMVVAILGFLFITLSPISVIFLVPARALGSLMLYLTRWLSQGRVMLSLRHDFVPIILLPVFLALAVLICIRLKKHKYLVAAPLLIGALALSTGFLVHRAGEADLVHMAFLSEGTNDGILLWGNDGTMICDSSNGSTTQLKSQWRALQEHGATELSVLMLTHYHSAQKVSLERLTRAVVVREIWLPEPTTKEDLAVLYELLVLAQREGLRVTVYGREAPLSVLGGELSLSDPLYRKRSVQPAFTLRFAYGDKTALYATGAYVEYLQKEGSTAVLTADTLILGAHGPIPHESVDLSKVTADRIITANDEKLLAQLDMEQYPVEIYGQEIEILMER